MPAREEILANWQTQLQAMDAADTESLAACYTSDATLTHMTGYVQPLPEWLAGIRAGTFVYHQVIEKSVDVTVSGERARLIGRILTGYRPDGSGQTWPLQLVEDFRLTDGRWLCADARAALG